MRSIASNIWKTIQKPSRISWKKKNESIWDKCKAQMMRVLDWGNNFPHHCALLARNLINNQKKNEYFGRAVRNKIAQSVFSQTRNLNLFCLKGRCRNLTPAWCRRSRSDQINLKAFHAWKLRERKQFAQNTATSLVQHPFTQKVSSVASYFRT